MPGHKVEKGQEPGLLPVAKRNGQEFSASTITNGERSSTGGHRKGRSGGKPAVYDFIGGPGQNAENPGQIDNRGAFADLVHV